MPFQKGNQLGKNQGRKGYEIEKKQLDKMSKVIDMDLNVIKRVYDGTATDRDYKLLSVAQVRVSKYLDKLHPSKSDVKMEVEKPIMIL